MSATTARLKPVVVIEDNATTNDLLCDWLRPHFATTGFLDAETAVRDLKGDSETTVFIVDFNLPGMNGLDLRGKLAPLYPAGKFILISGLFDEKLLAQAREARYDATMPKPFPMTALVAKVQELFELPATQTNLVELVKNQ